MAKFLLQSVDVGHRNGVKSMLVEADSAAIAKEIAAAQFDGDDVWGGATTTDLTAAFAADLEGYTYRIQVGAAALTGLPVVDVSYVAVASDTADLVGAALVTALNAHALIAGAAYDNGTNILTVAQTTDTLGDRTLKVDVTPPGGTAPMPSMRSTLVHQGEAGAALKVTLVQPTAVPAVGFSL